MKVESCFQLGYVVRSHGISGELQIFLDTDNPESYQDMESVYIEINNKLVPFFIKSLQLQDNRAIVRLEDVEDRDASDQLKGASLYLPMEFLPELEEDQFYYHEVIGYTVRDTNYGVVGRIANVLEANGNDLFSVMKDKTEILIPVKDELIRLIDKEAREIHVVLPEGLIEVYLNS